MNTIQNSAVGDGDSSINKAQSFHEAMGRMRTFDVSSNVSALLGATISNRWWEGKELYFLDRNEIVSFLLGNGYSHFQGGRENGVYYSETFGHYISLSRFYSNTNALFEGCTLHYPNFELSIADFEYGDIEGALKSLFQKRYIGKLRTSIKEGKSFKEAINDSGLVLPQKEIIKYGHLLQDKGIYPKIPEELKLGGSFKSFKNIKDDSFYESSIRFKNVNAKIKIQNGGNGFARRWIELRYPNGTDVFIKETYDVIYGAMVGFEKKVLKGSDIIDYARCITLDEGGTRAVWLDLNKPTETDFSNVSSHYLYETRLFGRFGSFQDHGIEIDREIYYLDS